MVRGSLKRRHWRRDMKEVEGGRTRGKRPGAGVPCAWDTEGEPGVEQNERDWWAVRSNSYSGDRDEVQGPR